MFTAQTITIKGGIEIPQIGFGTYKISDNAVSIIQSAIEVGYRHLDGAQMYRNEAAVGEAWTGSGVPRGEFFLTSKLDNPNHEPVAARESFFRTLEELQTDYVDLFLIHWPLPMYYGGDFGSTWAVLEQLREEGLARSIGVSNFEPHHLEKLFETAVYRPEVNQVESHPYFQNEAVHQFNDDHGIVTEAWSPLARGNVVDSPLLSEIGSRYDKTASQVALRWGVQRGDVIFPKASTKKRQAENLDIFDFELSNSEMQSIYTLDKGEQGRTGTHPDVMDRL